MSPKYVSLSVYTMNTSTVVLFLIAHFIGREQSVPPKLILLIVDVTDFKSIEGLNYKENTVEPR